MSSSFARVCKDVAKQLDDLCPVKSLSKANKFQLFAILQKTTHPWPWKPEDIPVGYSLLQILEPNFPFPEPEVSTPMPFKFIRSQKGNGGLDINDIAEGSVSAGFGDSHECDIEVQCTSIPEPKLEILQNRKLVDKEPSFMRHCRIENKDLYVVTEAYEVTKDTVVEDSSSVNLKGKLLLSLIAKFQAQGQEQNDKKCSVPIPKGAVVAYRKKKLVIYHDTCDILLFGNDKKKTFQGPQTRELSCELKYQEVWIGDVSPIGRLEEPLRHEFQHLQNDISEKTWKLASLSKDVQEVVFSSLLPMLRDRETLYDLMIMLELGELGHMDGPGGVILDELRKDSWIDLQDLILYLLHALMVLSDTQLNLLALSMEKRLLLQQRELVKSILQPNFKYPWNIPFSLQPELLAPLQGEGLAITYELLRECGLKMELNNPRSSWDLEAKMPMAALYGSLSFLQELVEPKSSSEPSPSPAGADSWVHLRHGPMAYTR